MNIFKHRHFKYDIIIWAVRWYCKYGISYRDLEEMLTERALDKYGNTIDFHLVFEAILSCG